MTVPLRSVSSSTRCYLRFLNCTDSNVDVIWINFTGQFVRYQLLESGTYVDINTYKQHPWTAINSDTKDPLHIDKQSVYEPITSTEYFAIKHPGANIPDNVETRIVVKITIPIYSLRFKCLLNLRNHFQDPDDVDPLPLPKSVVEDLKKTISERNNQSILPLTRIV